jgi:hypothetical protein
VLKRPRAKSGFFGVTAKGHLWQARIKYDGRDHHLGSFGTKEQAAAARDTAARQHHGERAVCNYGSQEEAEAAAAASTAANTIGATGSTRQPLEVLQQPEQSTNHEGPHSDSDGALIDLGRIKATVCPPHVPPSVHFGSILRQVIKEEEVERILSRAFQLTQSATGHQQPHLSC